MLVFTAALFALASTAPFEILTLSQAEAMAQAQQPSVKAALARVLEANERAKVPGARWLPRASVGLQLDIGSVNNTSASVFPMAGVDIPRISSTSAVRDSSFEAQPSTLAALTIRQMIFDFGRIGAESETGNAAAKSAKARAELRSIDARLAVDEAFLSVLASKAVLRAANEAIERARAHRDRAAAAVKNNLRPAIELTRSEADFERISAQRARAEGSLAQARLLLAAAIGRPSALVDASNEPIAFALPSLEEGLRRATDKAPEIVDAGWSLESARRERTAIMARYRPELSLIGTVFGFAGGGVSNNAPLPKGDGWLPSVANYSAAIALTIPLLDFDTRAQAKAADQRIHVATADRERVSQEVETRIRSAYIDREIAEAALPALERAVSAAYDNWSQAEARFNAGVGTSVELADAEALREQAEIDRALGEFARTRAAAAQRRALAEEQ